MDMYIVAKALDSTFDAVIPLGVHKMEFSNLLVPSFKMTATIASGIFTGTSISFLFTDLPVYFAVEPSVAIESFRIKLERSAKYQGPLAMFTIISTSSIYLLDRKKGFPWLVGGLLFCSSGILTGNLIKKASLRLLETNLKECSSENVRESFLEFGKLHAVRTLITFAGFGLFVHQLAFN